MLKAKNLLLITLALVFVSIGFISAAETGGSFKVDTGGGNIIIDPDGCNEDWSGSTWSQCVNNQQTFICFDKNTCATEDLKPSLCGEIRECDQEVTPPSSSGGGSGGGGGGGSSGSSGGSNPQVLSDNSGDSNSCTENWVCEKWSNSDQSCGTRICQDTNNCGTELLKPETSRICPYTSFAWITGAVLGVTSFAKSGVGISLIFIILIIALVVLLAFYKKKWPELEKNKARK